MSDVPPPTDAHLGQDFGCLSSKLALSFNDPENSQPTIARVPLTTRRGHPERRLAPNASHSEFEFISYAVVEDGKATVGRQALHHSDAIGLKVHLAKRCCLSRDRTLRRMPKGRQLLEAYDAGTITPAISDAALVDHFTLLREQALEKAADLNLVIKDIILTFPNFLCEREEKESFRRFKDHYLRLIRRVWGEDIKVWFSSEGQSIAVYICKAFKDSLGANRKRLLRHLFHDIKEDEGCALIIVDSGSSTLNIQCTTMYFDKNGKLRNSQSNTRPDWAPGTRGGSHLVNDHIRRIIEDQIPDVDPGEIAIMMQRFEEKKWGYDYLSDDELPLVLVGSVPGISATILPHEIRAAFEEVFERSLAVLKRELERFLGLARSIGILFCGGSFCNPGLLHRVEGLLEEVGTKEQRKKVKIRWADLPNFDHYWASAVSAGAAASLLNMPAPVQVLQGSAIGIQKLHKKSADDVRWLGSSEADVLLGLGHGRHTADFSLHHTRRSRTMFNLVCDPTYENNNAGTGTLGEAPIAIGLPKLDGSLCPYDLGWTIEGSELPCPRMRFSVRGADTVCIAANDPASLGSRPIIMVLDCLGLDKSKHDRCWRLTLTTDPVSNLLVVDKADSLPVWCRFCSARLVPVAWTCLTCKDFSACEDCYENEVSPAGHDKEHLFVYQDIEGIDDED